MGSRQRRSHASIPRRPASLAAFRPARRERGGVELPSVDDALSRDNDHGRCRRRRAPAFLVLDSTERTGRVASSAEILGLPLAHQLRERDGEDEAAAVEEVLDEGLDAEDREAGDAGDEEIDGDGRAPRIEAPRRDARRSEKGRREGGEQEGQARERVGGADGAAIEESGDRAQDARREKAEETDAIDPDAAQARDLAPAPDEEGPAAGGRVLEEIPEHDAEGDRVVEGQRDSEDAGDDDVIDQGI